MKPFYKRYEFYTLLGAVLTVFGAKFGLEFSDKDMALLMALLAMVFGGVKVGKVAKKRKKASK
jgi:hypothetical protein